MYLDASLALTLSLLIIVVEALVSIPNTRVFRVDRASRNCEQILNKTGDYDRVSQESGLVFVAGSDLMPSDRKRTATHL